MNNHAKRPALAALGAGMLGGLQWRLVLLWIAITLLPTLVVALPVWRVMDGLMSHSVNATRWASHFDGLMFSDVFGAIARDSAWTGSAFIAGVVLMLALSPFLTGMVVAGGRANRMLGFGALLQGGATEYGRMLRLLPLSLVPYGLFAAATYGMSSFTNDHVDAALLPSKAELYQHGGLAVILLVFVIAQAIIESARAQFIADIGLRSAFRALGRGIVQVVRRPFATLVVYLVITVIGAGLSVLIAAWRGHTLAVGISWLVAFVIVQLGVAVVAWMRTARLLALAGIAPVNPAHRRRRTDFAPAL